MKTLNISIFSIFLTATLVVSGFFIFINNVKAATIEVTPTYTAERDIVVKAADRIIDLQHTDGSWDWVVTNKTGPTGITYLNISGVTGELLIDAYKLTGDSSYLDGAKNTGDYLVNQVGPKVASSQRHNAFNIVFLYHLADIANDNQYKSQGDTILNHILYEENYFSLKNGSHCADDGIDGCIASELVEGIKNLRSWAGDPSGIIVWDLYHFVEAAQAAGENQFANDIADEIEIYMSQEGFDNTIQYYDLGLSAGIIALAKTGRDYSGYLSALLTEQETNDSFSNLGSEPVQTTAYALMAFKYIGEDSAAYNAFSYLIDNFGYNNDIDGWQEDDSKEYSEVTSEAGQAIFDYIFVEDIYYTIQDAINVANSGDTINVATGTYEEQVVIDKQLTLNGAQHGTTPVGERTGEESTIDGETSTAITISADNVIVDGFILDGGITLDDTANTISNATISNNIITGADSSAEPIKAQNGIRLGFDTAVMGGLGVDHVTIENNIISDNDKKGIRFANTKEHDGGPPQHTSYITISNNEIKDNGSAGIEAYGPGSNTIINNTISGNNGNGINLKFDDGDIVRGNTVTDNTGPGITLRQVTNSVVENNSVSGHTSTGVINTCKNVIGGKGSGIHIFDTSENNTIRFNEIEDNNYGIFIHSKDNLQPSNNSIAQNKIIDNDDYGILNALVDPPASVNAIGNYWGDSTGPGEVASGSGDFITANIDYSPWYADIELTSLKAPTSADPVTGDTVLELEQSIDIVSNDIIVSMPAEIIITATASWEGIINAPSIETVALDTPTPESGYNTTIDTIIEIGYPDIKLVFNKAVKILIPNQAGKQVGYTRTGEPFIEITNVCLDNTQATNDLLPDEGDCKIDVNNDLVVWTKHFTQFIVYSFSPIIIGPTFRAVRPPEPESEEEPSALSEEAQKLDTNKDDKIDDLDLKELFTNWGSTILDNIADFNNDSKVDVFDFNLLMIHWTE